MGMPPRIAFGGLKVAWSNVHMVRLGECFVD